MSRVNYLIQETGIVASLWKQYIDRKKKCEKEEINVQYYCFYEGKDDCKYYNTKFDEKSINIQHFDCKGKYKLLQFKEYMDERYSVPENILYFIDKDYDDKIINDKYLELKNDKKIYITPCYSIENFYTIEDVLKKIIVNEYKYTICCNQYDELLNKFISLKSEYHSIIQNVNYWYATYRYFSEKEIISVKILLSDLNLNNYFDVDKELEHIIERANLLTFLESKLDSLPIDFNKKYDEIKNKFTNNCCDFRGKFELHFLERFLLRIREHNAYNSFYVDKSNILSNLSQYAIKPTCFDEFIINQTT